MKLSVILLLTFAISTSSFAPSLNGGNVRVGVALEMARDERRSKTRIILKGAGRIAVSFATLALATSVIPPPALAAHARTIIKPKERGLLGVIEIDFLELLGGRIGVVATVAAGSFGLGAITAKIIAGRPEPSGLAITKINRVFSGAMPNKKLVAAVARILKRHGFRRKNTLLATSLCVDEINRVLERDFSEIYGDNFILGGLAGFPFGGITSFATMASHVPADNGSCLIVFGPHVGIDSDGYVGTVTEHQGHIIGGSCCGPAVAASNYVHGVYRNEAERVVLRDDSIDAQHNLVCNMLLPYAERLDEAVEKMVELPYALYDAQKEMMYTILGSGGVSNVANNTKIALLGGIQINTPSGRSDYFLPISFDLMDYKGNILEKLLPSLIPTKFASPEESLQMDLFPDD